MAVLQPTDEGNVDLQGTFPLDCGAELVSPTIRYAVYGAPNEQRDNVVLVCHALSGSARVADWWPQMFPGVLDTSRYCVVGTNILGSCYGSTGPGSTNGATEQTYASDFLLVTVRDSGRTQALVLGTMGIRGVLTAIGRRL